MSKITQTPWHAVTSSLDPKKHSWAIISDNQQDLIADVYRKRNWDGKKNSEAPEIAEANAKLLAAAPELLESLSHIVDWCIKHTPEYPAVLVRAKELLQRLE